VFQEEKMGDPKGFLKKKRQKVAYRPICERIKDFHEVAKPITEDQSKNQASRCMDCGTPFCHWACPVGNYIPEWNDLIFSGDWRKAVTLLLATNNLPEITGRVCPALCEFSCVLGINDDPVTIKDNELSAIEYAFRNGFIEPVPPVKRTGKRIAIIGSGPAGLACADQLNKAGHTIVVYERDDRIGGLLRYGIPDFKLEKWLLDRRIDIWEKEGIEFITGINVGADLGVDELLSGFDAVCLTAGSRVPRDLNIEGRDLNGIYFAMDFLSQSNKRIAGDIIPKKDIITAEEKRVVVIGGGDTGADCVGTAHRQGAACVIQIEVMPQPPECRTDDFLWPTYPLLLKTSTSHEEGGERYWAVLTNKFEGVDGKVKRLLCSKVEFPGKDEKGCPIMRKIEGSDFEIEADMAILAIGFIHPEHNGLLKTLNLEFDKKGNIKTDDNFMTSKRGIFAAGDCRRGQSLIVWAISEGRKAAYNIDKYLCGESSLPNM
jgi:glutamate synthase (NADPH) small chain